MWGFFGSVAVEVVTIYFYFNKGRALPKRYSKFSFWLIRILLASTAGGLVIAYDIQEPMLAFHLGTATPLIIQSLAQNAKDFIERK